MTFICLCLVGLWAVVFADDAISDVRMRLARRAVDSNRDDQERRR